MRHQDGIEHKRNLGGGEMSVEDERVGAQEGGELEPQCRGWEGEGWATAKFRGSSCHKTALISDSCRFRGPQDHPQVSVIC